jgi:Zn-dependent protease
LTLAICSLVVVALALLALPPKRLRMEHVYRVSAEDLWLVVAPHPSRPNFFDAIERYEWFPWSDTEANIHYRGGRKARYRQALRPEEMEGDQDLMLLNERGEPAQRLLCRFAVRPDPGGARLFMEVVFERVGRPGPSLLIDALLRRLTGASLRLGIAAALGKAGALARYEAAHGPAAAAPSLLGMRLSWTALALAVVACGWWTWSFGPWLTLALVVGLVAHETGHVAVMRAFGDRASAFYFVPFLGGVAVGRMNHAQDWRHAAMVLGGPVAGLASVLVAGTLGWLFDSAYLLACAAFFAALNLFNLLPVPPLDGGQLALIVLRPILPARALRHVMTALTGAGFLLALWLDFGLLTWVIGAMALASLLAPAHVVQPGREALSLGGAGLLFVISLALALLLAALIPAIMVVAITGDEALHGIATALVDGPFAE